MSLISTLKKGKRENSHFYPNISKHRLSSVIEVCIIISVLYIPYSVKVYVYQGDTGKNTHFPYLMFSIIKIISDHILEKINLILVLYFIFYILFGHYFQIFIQIREIIQISCISTF